MPNNQSQYRQFCQSGVDIPLFMQAWWLDLVCHKGAWEVCLSFDQGGQVTGVLPYYLMRQWGIQMMRLPLLTPYIGIWLRYPENSQKLERQYAFEKKEIIHLLRQLPRVSFGVHHHPVTLTNGLPFMEEGFQQSNRYTYRIAAGSSKATVYAGMKSSVRNKIEKAEKILKVIATEDISQFYQINQQSFFRQEKEIPYSLEFLQSLDRELATREQRQILLAQDQNGNVHAAIYLVWDQSVLYNLALGGDTERRKSGAIQLLLWKGIQIAIERGLTFDFEGSILPSVEGVFRAFGAQRVPYLRTVKTSNRFWRLVRAWKN